jgi:crotonobetainyl-CoA:carnitine CoA-transferase CaiB-like acyl-CoA transferase
MGGPLAGVRVLELGGIGPGPFAGMVLSDLGADVVRVERPGKGPGPATEPGRDYLLRNRRSVTADLKSDEGREFVLQLVAKADVLIEGFRPGVAERLGLGPEDALARNERLIYAGIHGWRDDGPYSGRPAYDDIIQGLCGISGLMDQLTGEPRYAPTILCDKTCGLVASQAILAALYHREQTGRGQFIEIPLFETMVSFVMVEHLHGRTFVPAQGGLGYSRVLAPWRRPYRTADGFVCMLAYTDRQWQRLWTEIGKPEMMADRRFVDMAARSRNIDEVYRLAGEQLLSRTTAEWIKVFDTLEIPAGPVNSLEQVMNDPHLDAIGFFRHMQHPTEGEIVLPDIAVQFADAPGAIDRLPPRLGEHGREILSEIGMRPEDIDALAQCGALVLPADAEPVR